MRRAVVCAVVALALASPAAALAHRGAPRIDVLSNRADLISGGDALVAVRPRPAARRPLNGARRRRRDFTATLRGRRRPRHRPRRRPQRLTAHARRRARRADHDHQPPDRRPGLRRPAGPAVGLQDEAAGLRPAPTATRSATRRRRLSYVYKDATTGQFAAYDPEPARRRRRRHDDDRPGQDGALHRARRARREDRGIYAIAGARRPAGWNHKLLTTSAAAPPRTTRSGAPIGDLDDIGALARVHGRNNSSSTSPARTPTTSSRPRR